MADPASGHTAARAAAGRSDDAPPSGSLLGGAVHRSGALSREGLLERAFTAAFSGLVYAQIWEDPEVDIAGLELQPGAVIVCIASGGCNLMSYLTADPAKVIAVDLNPHHVALVRLKALAAQKLPTYQSFLRMFGHGADPANVSAYQTWLREALDPDTRAYWDGRDGLLRRRIDMFARGLYRQGLLGRFLIAGNWLARRFGVRLSRIVHTDGVAGQTAFFDAEIAPLFRRPFVRWLTRRKASLFGLGIPPAQYDALCGDRPMAEVLEARLRRLLCGWPMAETYFAWQAATIGYAAGNGGPLPLYLQARHWPALRDRAARVQIENVSMTDRLAALPAASVDAVTLLDAQDWMTDAQLTALWTAITHAARPGARVVFRTAGEDDILPGRVPEAVLGRWRYLAERSAELHAQDRSAIYGGFHIYRFEG
jgi:S-adenosylmethionine-diacylglycerol 3-amino-3-carboxypropyl transferase